jgi:alkylation response protein AidB-like acyl-CoA dehydrogenase
MAARTLLYDSASQAWVRASAGESLKIEQRARLRLASTHAVRTSADAADRAYEAGGGTSIFADSRLQRCFRDLHTITQHMIVGRPTFELAGRILLGVETDVSQL